MDFSKILELFNQPRLIFGLACSAGITIFLPVRVLEYLGLVQFRQTFLPYIGGVFIVTGVYCLIHGSTKALDWLTVRKNKKQIEENRQKFLRTLTNSEQVILHHFIKHGTRTQRLDINSGVVNGLVDKGIIDRAADIATSGLADISYYGPVYTCDHNMRAWAWEALNEDKDLVADGAKSETEQTNEA